MLYRGSTNPKLFLFYGRTIIAKLEPKFSQMSKRHPEDMNSWGITLVTTCQNKQILLNHLSNNKISHKQISTLFIASGTNKYNAWMTLTQRKANILPLWRHQISQWKNRIILLSSQRQMIQATDIAIDKKLTTQG